MIFMSEVDLNSKDLKRILSILSDYFGKRKMDKFDNSLRKKLEVMLDSELEYETGYENNY